VIRRILEYPRLYAAALGARRRVRRLPLDLPLAEAVAFGRAFTWRGGRLRATQSTEEILWLLELVRELRPATVVEIGTDEGGTLFLWTWVAAPDATLVAVDVRPLGLLGRWSTYAFVRRGLARERQRVKLVMPVDSQSPATVDRVRRLLGDRPVDFLFVDGDHSYDAVKRDYELWSPLVRRGGLIAFHDVKPDAPNDVPRFWSDLKRSTATEECIAGDPPSYGIGVVRVA
jgi:cephalosporin hydroxylase